MLISSLCKRITAVRNHRHARRLRWPPPHPHPPTQAVQNMVAIEGSKASQSVQNCLVAGNFVLAPGSRRKSQQSAGVLLRGAAAPRLVNTAVLYQVRRTDQPVSGHSDK